MLMTNQPKMQPSKPGYRITPTLLGKWTDLVNADRDWEQFYGNADEPSISPEEYYRQKEQELIDACNREGFVSEAASRGTALNEIVDCIIENRPERPDMKVSLVKRPDNTVVAVQAELDGFSFQFDNNLVNDLASYFDGAICQHRCEAVMDTCFGPVVLYGDIDYIIRDVIYDLKSTSRYNAYGKFSEGWQKDLYPWALIESGEMNNISGFEYTIVPLSGGTPTSPIIMGEIKTEWYDYSHGSASRRLRQALEAFIPWIEAHRSQIVHPRIFNQI